LGYRLPEKNRKAGAEMRCKLQEIGILRDSGHEHFNGSLVILCEALIDAMTFWVHGFRHVTAS